MSEPTGDVPMDSPEAPLRNPSTSQTQMITPSGSGPNIPPGQVRLIAVVPGAPSPSEHVFSITAPLTTQILDWKKLVKQKQEPKLDYIDASDLSIWKLKEATSINEIDNFLTPGVNLPDIGVKLGSADEIGQHFKPEEVNRKFLHIVVGVPFVRLAGVELPESDRSHKRKFPDLTGVAPNEEPVEVPLIDAAQVGPSDDEPPFKKRRTVGSSDSDKHSSGEGRENTPWRGPRLSEEDLRDAEDLWKKYWVDQKDMSELCLVDRPQAEFVDISGYDDETGDSMTPSTPHDGEGDKDRAPFMVHHLFYPKHPRRILIRQDYLDIYKLIEGATGSSNRVAIIIGGQPGIGKSTMLYYILVKRLLAKKTTYFQRSPNYLIKFGPTGVRIILDRVRLHDTEETTGGEFPWALVDSDMKVTQPASCLLDSFTHVVYATSPKKERDSWAKHVGAKLGLTMKPWTWTELVHGLSFNSQDIDQQQLFRFYTQYGPSARYCYQYARQPSWYLEQLRYQINQLTFDTLYRIISGGQNSWPDMATHLVLLLHPDEDREKNPIVSVITKHVLQMLLDSYLFSSHPKWRVAAGWVLEDFFHDCLKCGGQWNLKRMTYTPLRKSQQSAIHKWTSNATTLPLNISPLETYTFGEKKALERPLKPTHYYQPESDYNATYDSFIVQGSDVFMFQHTPAPKHGAKAIRFDRLCKLLGPDYRLRYVVVVPFGAEIEVVVPKVWAVDKQLEVFCLDIRIDNQE